MQSKADAINKNIKSKKVTLSENDRVKVNLAAKLKAKKAGLKTYTYIDKNGKDTFANVSVTGVKKANK